MSERSERGERTIDTRGRRLAPAAEVSDAFLDALRRACTTVVAEGAAIEEAGRDWWPLGLQWQYDALVPAPPAAVARPTTAAEVADVLRLCSEHRVPVTAAGGRSGVNGASVPVHGGLVLDTTALAGIVDVDAVSMTVEVRPGTFGDVFEQELRDAHGLTCGHWPQSMAISTVGGWLACRGAGQLSTRYGKIEDMVVALEVALADGTLIRTGGAPRAAVGPDLTQLFVGSEGTLGVITAARLRAHPAPPAAWHGAWAVPSFDAGLELCRRILQRGATPAVLRLYDAIEGERGFSTGERTLLLVLDEADAHLVHATSSIVTEELATAERLDDALVDRWMEHRNDVSALHALTERGFALDTMEVAAPWAALPAVYARCIAALQGVDGMLMASAHQSHAYTDGACLYFTFAGQPPRDDRERFYVASWDAAQRAALDAGASLSHHHGVGLNRARFMDQALGGGLGVLQAVKDALDPAGVLNPGKLGLRSPFGEVTWP
jgi:alkyldihydroxyacetonephosphate synthase